MLINYKSKSSKKVANKGSIKYCPINEKTPFGIVESYKIIRYNILFSLSAKKLKTVVFTSAEPSEGKSTTCVNFAVTLSQTGKKVMLIDADLRKPNVHKLLGLKNIHGLSNILGNFNINDDVIHKSAYDNLDVITAGEIPPNPSELLQSDMMKSTLDSLSGYYDYIVIDTPPVNVVSDTLGILDEKMGVALVCRHNKTSRDSLNEALIKCKHTSATILGVILNRVKHSTKSAGHYAYNYKYGEN